MKHIEQLIRVIAKETDYAEKLREVIQKKQQAIIGMNGDELAQHVQAEEQIIAPLQTLEEERVRLLQAIVKNIPNYSTSPISSLLGVDTLIPFLSEEDARNLSQHLTNLRNTVATITQLNENNKALIVHSHRFVQGMLRILTDNYKRQFVDQKM